MYTNNTEHLEYIPRQSTLEIIGSFAVGWKMSGGEINLCMQLSEHPEVT